MFFNVIPKNSFQRIIFMIKTYKNLITEHVAMYESVIFKHQHEMIAVFWEN